MRMKKKIEGWVEKLAVAGCPDEFEAKALLTHFGISIPCGTRLKPGDVLDKSKMHFPAVVKVCSAHILHKTDHEGVMMGVDRNGIDEVVKTFRETFSGAPVLVEEQVHFRGPELIVGALVDPSFGPAVMTGAGGTLTELYKDVSFRLAPCCFSEAERMIRELVVSPAFSGYRGLRCDPRGLARIIVSAGELAISLGDRFSQLDINPLVYSGDRWVALDAKVVLEESCRIQ
jgi:succinyl-CoA synthetase beta subunit